MNVKEINASLLCGAIGSRGVFPHLDSLQKSPVIFDIDFGLPELPRDPGIILIRGARQYGKSTWLENQLRQTIIDFGPGSAQYLNGDELRSDVELADRIRTAVSMFPSAAALRRLFIDEITAVDNWQKVLKRLADAGEIGDLLVITTGSKATDLRRGMELLPGRKGKLARTSYYFVPLSYAAYTKTAGARLGKNTLAGYLLSGGCPIAAAEVVANGSVPEFIIEMIRDWIHGECTAAGRDRSSLKGVFDSIIRYGGTPCGQAKIARESGLANNTVAAGYLEFLMDCMCISTSFSWDKERAVSIRRKPAKYHFINLIAALCWHPDHPVTLAQFNSLPPATQGLWHEWAVAQEIWRRAALRGDDFPELMNYWQSDNHEIDFVASGGRHIEVKRGSVSPQEYAWYPHSFPKGNLTLVNAARFETAFCRGMTIEDFLLEP